MNKTLYTLLFFTSLLVWSQESVDAWNSDQVAIHGFGGWAYGKTDQNNQFFYGNEDGKYDEVNFSLNITATPFERLSLCIQPGYHEDAVGDDAQLDYAFAEWFVSDSLQIRAGKVKAPSMLYTEIYDVGTLRPFFDLPHSVYKQLAAKAYKGIGITGTFAGKPGWELLYDLYGGTLSLHPNTVVDFENTTFVYLQPTADDMFGGRLTLRPPVDGLSLSVSSYSGDVTFEIADTPYQAESFGDYYSAFGLSLEYLTDRWSLRSEYLTQRKSSKVEADVAYVEVAYWLTEQWQLAARYEHLELDTTVPYFLLYPSSFREHDEAAVGINYWLNPSCVFKSSFHVIEGNRFAYPDDLTEYLQAVAQGKFDERTYFFSFGVQFSF